HGELKLAHGGEGGIVAAGEDAASDGFVLELDERRGTDAGGLAGDGGAQADGLKADALDEDHLALLGLGGVMEEHLGELLVPWIDGSVHDVMMSLRRNARESSRVGAVRRK